tara:strand:+ start:310 stop:495 length:186 start_codon:yes stop_codon:yes gene_type:complete
MQKNLTEKEITSLREKNLLGNEETAYWVGDKLVAENVVTRTRRVIDSPSLVLESRRGLLKG